MIIVMRKTPNFGYPRGAHGRLGLKPLAIVMHIAQGTLEGCDAWFENPHSMASTHFCIGKEGEVHQYLDVEDAAWANGVVTNPDWFFPGVHSSVNPNLYTISIEHEGLTGEPWTDAMYRADEQLIKLLCFKYNIPLLPGNIFGHNVIDPVNRSRDPGPGLDWDRLYKLLTWADKEN